MLQYAKSKNIWSRISSNLSLKFKEGLGEFHKIRLNLLHIDIDGLIRKYAKYRKRDLKLFENLRKILEIKKTNNLDEPKIEIAMLARRAK